jgi:uncharacterized protein
MMEGPRDIEFVFVLKLSKFCNLRCSYCYEHRELHLHDRMSLKTLSHLFADIDAFGDHLSAFAISPTFSFVWHGGEPLLVRPEYYQDITALQTRHIRRFSYRNTVQSNLYGSIASTLSWVLAANWDLGISIDFARNVRRNLANRDSDERVAKNAETLHKSGVRFGIVSVLGKHNVLSIVEAYDWVQEFAESWRILPLFDGGPEASIAQLRLADTEIARVLFDILERRSNSDRHVPIDPIDGFAAVAMSKLIGEPREIHPFRNTLDSIFVVNVNGDVYTRPFAYNKRYCLGNINEMGMSGLARSAAYRRCQTSIRHAKRDTCTACDHRGYCDSSPIHEHWSVTVEGASRTCVHPRLTIQAIENGLRREGVDRGTIGDWARGWLDGSLTEGMRISA